MTPYRLEIKRLSSPSRLAIQWFGESPNTPIGTQTLPLATGALAAASDAFWIDLYPLAAEIALGSISDEGAFRKSPDLALLRDLLVAADFRALAKALYSFLQRMPSRIASLTVAAPDGAWQMEAYSLIMSRPDQRLVRVWFGSEQKLSNNDDTFVYGQCSVFVPKSHRPGLTGSSVWRRFVCLGADDRLSVKETLTMAEEDFWISFNRSLESGGNSGERNAFVFIHGYKVGFNEAAIRAAQLGFDLKIPGEMIFYHWSTQKKYLDYLKDETSISSNIASIANFLRQISERSGAKRLHVFVHSMGNRGFLSALERLKADGQQNLQLGQVFFCAPDEDVRVFRDKATKFPHESENRTILVSPDDKPLKFSRKIHGHDRVGITPPVTVIPGMETVEVKGFGLFELGHDYFASAEPVILDIREAIETKKRAGDREIPRQAGRHFTIDVREERKGKREARTIQSLSDLPN